MIKDIVVSLIIGYSRLSVFFVLYLEVLVYVEEFLERLKGFGIKDKKMFE